MSEQNKSLINIVRDLFSTIGETPIVVQESKFTDIPSVQDGALSYEHAGTGSEGMQVVDVLLNVTDELRRSFTNDVYPICRANGIHFVSAMNKGVRHQESKFVGLRFFWDVDHECFEHPEIFLGAPLGQYHCTRCGLMICAGVPHPSVIEYIVSEMKNELEMAEQDYIVSATSISNVLKSVSEDKGLEYIGVGDNIQTVVDVLIKNPDPDFDLASIASYVGTVNTVTLGVIDGYTWSRLFPQDRLTSADIEGLVSLYKTYTKNILRNTQ